MDWKITPKTQPMRPHVGTERPVVLRAEKLVKIYKKRAVVNGVSFEVREGEIVGLLGANGAGKTTSFRMACGLIPANGGTVTLNGIDVTTWPMHRRTHEGRLGYLPQDRSTFGALTTEQNLLAPMEYLGYSRAQQKKKCEEMLEKFNLRHIRDTKVGYGGSGGLSGGERRRLEIARALLSNPKILLLDEPFANVDPVTVDEMQKVVRDLAQEGVAILITDHQVAETLDITNRSYIVYRGEVLCSGTPIEVLSNEQAIKTYFGKNAKNLRERFQKGLSLRMKENDPRDGNANAGKTTFASEPMPSRPRDADEGVRTSDPMPPRLRDADEGVRTSEPMPPRLRDTNEGVRAPDPDGSAGANASDDRANRPVLALKRRPNEPTRSAPAVNDQEKKSNRFDSKLKGLFGGAKRR